MSSTIALLLSIQAVSPVSYLAGAASSTPGVARTRIPTKELIRLKVITELSG